MQHQSAIQNKIQAMKKQLLLLAALCSSMFACTEDHEIESTAYELNPATSVAEWKGHQRTGYFNEGTITVGSDVLTIVDGKVQGGSFTIPVSSIVNFNLPTDELKHQLVHHLQSADFFNMALHPEVTYQITSVVPFSESGDGIITGANYQVNGNLTILGVTKPVNFPARIVVNGSSFALEATTQFDRTQFGITYASDPALPDDHYIKPMVDVHLKLSGSRK